MPQKNHNSKSEASVRSSSTSDPKVQAVQLKECGGADSKELIEKPEATGCCAVVPAVLPKEDEVEGIKERAEERMGTVSVNKESKHYPKVKRGRYTLDWWKCYLDSCASYHTFFVREFLCHTQDSSTTMNGSCNAGSVLLRQKGWYKNFQVWLNENGIVNLLPIPMLEEAG